MGPAPLTAIKNGEIYAGYDTGFVFAEVNADYVKWIASRDDSGNIVFEGRCTYFPLMLSVSRRCITNFSVNFA